MRMWAAALLALIVAPALAGTTSDAAGKAKETINAFGSSPRAADMFNAGKSFAASPKGSAAVRSAITGENAASTVPGYATTHERSSLFAGGDGELVGPGNARVAECATTTYADKRKQYECDAINDMARNRSTRPAFTISPTDPIIAKGKAVKADLEAIASAFGSAYTACQNKTVETPAVYKTEICSVMRDYSTSSCVYGREIDIDADSNFLCDKTVNAYETHKCRRSVQPNIREMCDANTPYTYGTTTVSQEWWWCGDSCEPRADSFINTLVSFATTRAGLSLVGIYRSDPYCDAGCTLDGGVCRCPATGGSCPSGCTARIVKGVMYCSCPLKNSLTPVSAASACRFGRFTGYLAESYFAEFSGPRNIDIYMNGVYMGSSKFIGYRCNITICHGSVSNCFGKSSRKPMINFRASISEITECKNKVWTCHHNGRFPCHWSCKDAGVLCSDGALTPNPDGSYSCISNCRNVLDGVTPINECAALEARSQ